MARQFHYQIKASPPLIGTGPLTLVTLPKGFKGYVRVKFYSETASDQMFGMWVPINSENQPQGAGRLGVTNSAILWVVNDEKVWDFPADEMALVVFVNSLNGVAYVDCGGIVEDE